MDDMSKLCEQNLRSKVVNYKLVYKRAQHLKALDALRANHRLLCGLHGYLHK